MAHKGFFWEVRQSARIWSGVSTWPEYPAKRYKYSGDPMTVGGIAYDPTDRIIEPYDDATWAGISYWRDEPQIVGAVEVQIGLVLWHPGLFLMPHHITQIWVNDVAQYDLVPENFLETTDWQFVANVGPLQTPAVGAVAAWDNVCQYTAVQW